MYLNAVSSSNFHVEAISCQKVTCGVITSHIMPKMSSSYSTMSFQIVSNAEIITSMRNVSSKSWTYIAKPRILSSRYSLSLSKRETSISLTTIHRENKLQKPNELSMKIRYPSTSETDSPSWNDPCSSFNIKKYVNGQSEVSPSTRRWPPCSHSMLNPFNTRGNVWQPWLQNPSSSPWARGCIKIYYVE